MKVRRGAVSGVVCLLALLVLAGTSCPIGTTDPTGFTNANLARGGALYDKWWAVTGATEPTGDHPLWASRPDATSNTRTGADTWRCKECHAWDYMGKDGAYATGSSHATGITGIFGTTKTAQEVFDLIKTAHGFGAAGLSDDEIWNLAKFVLGDTGAQFDTRTIIDGNNAFTGTAATGQTLYTSGIGTGLACVGCHGTDGLTIPPGAPATHDEWVGKLANDNPQEFQHKVRFGQPNATAMPSSVANGGTTQEVSDLGTYAQTLPES